ncbi:type IV secretory system conjugative DNA transfer family protein, partial [Streptomyces lydicus]
MDRHSAKQIRGGGGDGEAYAPLIATGLGFGVAEGASLSMRLAPWFGGPDQDGVTWQPLDLAIRMLTGEVVWTAQATYAAAGLGVTGCAACALTVCGARYLASKPWQRRGGRITRERVDSQAKFMARGKELADLGRKAMAAKASKLKVELGPGDAPGVLIGRAVLGGQPLYGSYEDLHLDIWGPRSGKSTSRVIPAVMEAIGAVVATSNKRDVVDATRVARAEKGTVHVFDPQGVAGEPVSWYWDPVAWVLGEEGGPDAQERAAELAGHFAAGGDADKRDAFFDPEGEDLLAGLFLACALAKHPITQVFKWVTNPGETEPVEILGAHGFDLVAAALSDQYQSPEKQRAGIFATAKKMSACLKYERIRPWVTPPQQGERPRTAFDVAEFVRSTDTLY